MKAPSRGLTVTLLLVGSVAFAVLGQNRAFRQSPIVQALIGNWDFVKSVQHDNSLYYRLKLKLAYKGEPQDFDIVVGCNVQQTNYGDGGRTYEVGLTPTIYGRRMSDGKGLVVRPPRACRGETTENGDIPPDLLPLVVVYDDPETLAFGAAYLTDDAYDSPLSDLKFGGATIERADRVAFDKFRSEQPNLVKRSSYLTVSGLGAVKEAGIPAARIPMGTGCHGYARFRLNGAQKDHAHELWPVGRPRYWRPVSIDDREAINPRPGANVPMLTDHEDSTPTPATFVMSQLDFEVPNQGMPRRHPSEWGKRRRPTAPSYYPDVGGWVALPWPADAAARAETLFREGPHVGASIDFRAGATRGFGYCRPIPQNFPTGVAYPNPTKEPSIAWLRMPQVNFVDAVEVANPAKDWDGPKLIVERDEFIFVQFRFGLGSTRGDV